MLEKVKCIPYNIQLLTLINCAYIFFDNEVGENVG
jgi:hypothetical protein